MRRADRLFRIVQLLRSGRLKTAHALAERLQVSERTIYRDIVDLQLAGQPIEGEAGVGYTLPANSTYRPSCSRLKNSPPSSSARAWSKPGEAQKMPPPPALPSRASKPFSPLSSPPASTPS
jgi:biotin operon repressor